MNTPEHPMRAAEICTALSAALYGLWMLSPFTETFATFGGVYFLLARVAGENVWGSLFVAAGAIMLYGTVTQRRWARIIGSFLVLVLRLFLVVLVGGYTHYSAQGVPDYSVWALLSFFVLMGAMRRDT
jgi:hypothetical protein